MPRLSRSEFCCETTVDATLSLKRCSLRANLCQSSRGLGGADEGQFVPHDLLLERAAHDQSINVDDLLLAQAMRPIHRLQVLHRIPVVLDEDDGVRTGQVESEPADVGRQEQAVDGRVRVEGLAHGVTFRDIGSTVQAHIGHVRHHFAQQVMLDNVEHSLLLTEDQSPVLRESAVRFGSVGAGGRIGSADTTVEEDLSARAVNKIRSRSSAASGRKDDPYCNARIFGACTMS